MKFYRIYENEKGSMSLILSFVVVTICAILVLKASTAFDVVNKQHKKQKQKAELLPKIHQIGQLIKQSYVISQIDSSCSSTGAPGDFKAKSINGTTFCFPEKKGFCIDIPDSSNPDKPHKVCASPSPESMKWDEPISGVTEIKEHEEKSPTTNTELHTVNRISVPNTSNPLWRSCSSPNVCVRIVLCPEDMDDCTLSEAQAVQTIRLGDL